VGRQAEEGTQMQISAENNCKPQSELEGLWKHNLQWTLESRYLLRYLVDSLKDQPIEKREVVLNTVQEKAQLWWRSC